MIFRPLLAIFFVLITKYGNIYAQTPAENANSAKVDTVATLQALQNYQGAATTIILTDALRGGIFHLVNSAVSDSGTVFYNYTTRKFWQRQYNQAFGVNVLWFGAKGDYAYGIGGTDDYEAIQNAINSKNEKVVSVYFPGREGKYYGISHALSVGQGTKLFGDNALFPVQNNAHDTIFYAPQSSIYAFNNTGALTMQTNDNYRNQAVFIKDLLFAGTGKTKGQTGLLFNSNPAYVTINKNSQDAGLLKIDHVFVTDFTTGIDFCRLDTYFLDGGSHLQGCRVGAKNGKQDGRIQNTDFYDCDTGLIAKGAWNIYTLNEFEPSSSPDKNGIAFVGDSLYGCTIMNNNFKNAYKGIVLDNVFGGYATTISSNVFFYLKGTDITIDSGHVKTRIVGNYHTHVTGSNIYARKTDRLIVDGNSFIAGPRPAKASITVDSSTNIAITNNIDNDYPDSLKLSISGPATTYNYDEYTSYTIRGTTNANTTPSISFQTSSGTFQHPATLAANLAIGGVYGNGYTGSDYSRHAAGINMVTNNAWSKKDNSTKINFDVTPRFSKEPQTEGNISGAGLRIGDTTQARSEIDIHTNAPSLTFTSTDNYSGVRLNVEGRAEHLMRFEYNGAEVGEITTDGSLSLGTSNAPNATAVLDLASTGKGLLIPRLTTKQRLAIANPATGLLVYDSTAKCPFWYNGNAWVSYTPNLAQTTINNAGNIICNLTNLTLFNISPTKNCTLTAIGGVQGQRCSFAITSTTPTPCLLTFGENFKSQGLLSTSPVKGKIQIVEFIYDGKYWDEISRTKAM